MSTSRRKPAKKRRRETTLDFAQNALRVVREATSKRHGDVGGLDRPSPNGKLRQLTLPRLDFPLSPFIHFGDLAGE